MHTIALTRSPTTPQDSTIIKLSGANHPIMHARLAIDSCAHTRTQSSPVDEVLAHLASVNDVHSLAVLGALTQ